MNTIPTRVPDPDPIATAAAEWVLRLDRGLTAAEQDEYSQWLASEARHGEAVALHRWGWEEMNRLAGLQTSVHAWPDPDLLSPVRRIPKFAFRAQMPRYLPLVLMAAAVIFGLWVWWPRPSVPTISPSYALSAPIERRILEDGSIVDMNRGAKLVVQFMPGERRVLLTRGEATFTVAKNAARPFIVSASGVEVRAVGTVFNVRLNDRAVEVLVTEGKVRVALPTHTTTGAVSAAVATTPKFTAYLKAGEHTIVPFELEAVAPKVVSLTLAEIEQRLAWQPLLLDCTDTPLSEIVRKFNRHNPVRMIIADSELGELRLSASFRSDNMEGFVRLMESDFGLRAEWRSETEVVLHKTN